MTRTQPQPPDTAVQSAALALMTMQIAQRDQGSAMVKAKKIAPKEEYSTTEASELLGLKSRTTLWEAIQKGELPASRYGKRGIYRIAHEDLVRYAIANQYKIPPALN